MFHSPPQPMWDLTIRQNVSFSSPTDVRSHNPPDPYKECFVLKFMTLIKNVSFSSPTDVRSHNPPDPYKECFILLSNQRGISQSTSFRTQHFFNQCGTPQSIPLRGPTSLLARSMSSSDINFNGPNPPLVDIVLVGFPFLGFPSQGF